MLSLRTRANHKPYNNLLLDTKYYEEKDLHL